jgi:hypothetical protein
MVRVRHREYLTLCIGLTLHRVHLKVRIGCPLILPGPEVDDYVVNYRNEQDSENEGVHVPDANNRRKIDGGRILVGRRPALLYTCPRHGSKRSQHLGVKGVEHYLWIRFALNAVYSILSELAAPNS